MNLIKEINKTQRIEQALQHLIIQQIELGL